MVTVRRGPGTERLAGIPGGTPGTITRDPTRDPRTERVTITASQLATGPNGDGLVVSGRVPRGQEQAFLGGRREFWVPAGTPWVTVAPTVVIEPTPAVPPTGTAATAPTRTSSAATPTRARTAPTGRTTGHHSPALAGNPSAYTRRGETAGDRDSNPERATNRNPAPQAQSVTRTAPQPRPQTPPLVTVPRAAPRGPGISIPNPMPVIRFFQRLADPFGGT